MPCLCHFLLGRTKPFRAEDASQPEDSQSPRVSEEKDKEDEMTFKKSFLPSEKDEGTILGEIGRQSIIWH
jgi:hypothetical protein